MKQVRGARILGTGSFVPPKVLTNFDMASMVDTSDEWIRTRTGIQERHIAEDGVAASDLAAEAARLAISEAGISPLDVDLLIVGTVTADRAFPSAACSLQEKLGTFNAGAFDLSAGCTGFIYGMSLATGLIGSSLADVILVVGVETLSKLVDWTDRNTCVVFGDGAGALRLPNRFRRLPRLHG